MESYNLDRKSISEITASIKNYSPSITDMAIINQIQRNLMRDLPGPDEDLRNVLIYALKEFHIHSPVLLQQLTMMPSDERDQAIQELKTQILTGLERVYKPSIPKSSTNSIQNLISHIFSTYEM
jgi:hypothetical protein